MYQGNFFPIMSFKGGYCGNLPVTQLGFEQASDLDNIVVLPGGQGFRTRHGNQKWHIPTLVVQDLTYTAISKGSVGEAVTIAYTTGGTAGSEIVTVTGTAISIKIQSGVSTATGVKAKFDASADAIALASCTISGTGGTAQTAPVTATPLACAALNSGANIQGIGHLLQADQDKWLIVVCGAKIYSLSNYTGAYTEITGTASITAAADNLYDIFTFNDKVIGFGGPPANPGAPWTWTGASTAAALTNGPSTYGGFTANNRVFAYRTAAAPSTVFWSIIGDPTDWSGTGAGSAVIGSLSDGQRVTAAIVISTNYVLVFKENSTYQMVISSAPFPVYSLFDNVGCVGKKAAVNVDGQVYFINMRGEMCSTDGQSLKRYPPAADNLWDAVQSSRYPYIIGFRESGSDHDWLIWSVSTTGSTNNTSIVWDLANECWLQCTSGYDINVTGIDHLNNVYLGDYAGFVYRPDISTQYRDDTTTPGTITAYWRSGWLNPSKATEIVQVSKITANYKIKASGSLTVNYGFDFTADSASFTLSQIATASETYTSRGSMLTGRGNFFQFKISQSSAAIDSEVHGILLQGKSYGQKVIGND
jgi:hypothetical protein